MKTIRRYGNIGEAGYAKSLLEAAGIEASLADENAGTLLPGLAPWGMRLQVEESDEERAVQILDQGVPDSDDAAPQEPVPMEHEVPPSVRAVLTCPNCGTEWELTPQEAAAETFTCEDCKTTFPVTGES